MQEELSEKLEALALALAGMDGRETTSRKLIAFSYVYAGHIYSAAIHQEETATIFSTIMARHRNFATLALFEGQFSR